MNNLQLCKYLISVNKDLINRTGLRNCHCLGLSSFIINEKPKIRLFIAEENCELFQKFDYLNPIIPVHSHKYDDIFTQLEGNMINHLYRVGGVHIFNKYKYKRLNDTQTQPQLLGKEGLDYLGAKNNLNWLKANELHTASLEGERCSWIVTETFETKDLQGT